MTISALGKTTALAMLLVAINALQEPAKAQITDLALSGAGAAIGTMAVGKVLDDLQRTVQNVGSILNNDFNLDYGNAFITLQSGTQGVLYALDNERSKIVNDLDTQRKEALLDVYVLANDMLKKEIPFEQAKLKVDTLTVLNHVRLIRCNCTLHDYTDRSERDHLQGQRRCRRNGPRNWNR